MKVLRALSPLWITSNSILTDKNAMRRLPLIAFILSVFCPQVSTAQVFITHAQTGYDSSSVSENEIQKVMLSQNQKVYFLSNNKSEWYIKQKNKDVVWLNSEFGEHQIKADSDQVILMGHNTGACLQHTFIDLLKYYQGSVPFNVHFPSHGSVTTASSVTFGDELKGLSKADKLERIIYYFQRHQSYYQRDLPNKSVFAKKWARIKFAYNLNGIYLGGSKKPEVILWVWDDSKKMESFISKK